MNALKKCQKVVYDIHIYKKNIFLYIPKTFDDKCEQNINQFIDEMTANVLNT